MMFITMTHVVHSDNINKYEKGSKKAFYNMYKKCIHSVYFAALIDLEIRRLNQMVNTLKYLVALIFQFHS